MAARSKVPVTATQREFKDVTFRGYVYVDPIPELEDVIENANPAVTIGHLEEIVVRGYKVSFDKYEGFPRATAYGMATMNEYDNGVGVSAGGETIAAALLNLFYKMQSVDWSLADRLKGKNSPRKAVW